ncbi:CDP-diacylglycerol---serine O-phosphatidyltransferase [Cyclobacterium lianum]|uniref:CDP-diacylglycerol--serine O-phosphatidyltransferase n=1 Tax=Cyclobacterium lianum TaxID=388280 RepID=A0A1M7PWQ4_9BACT|nr:CDP-diacylglycerol--serine O-phosphatidyltransferase [Cyclobacterium lianum]SHN22090.1 CDP-diacylglycerol---serine O-phosphatidyltransferase [Cyclobacterium lianum]
MSVIRHIPNTLTCLNLLSGMIGILYVVQNGPYYGFYFILAAAVFDFFDGFAARWLKVQGEMGKQLDSLADMVTFGVLPSFIAFFLIQSAGGHPFLPYLAFLIGIQSALRLAKFNIDERQEDRFIGLPTPANALFFSTLPLLAAGESFFGELLQNPWLLSTISVLFALLLTAEIPLIALKFKDYSWKNNLFRYLLVLVSAGSLAFWGWAGIPLAVLAYILLSLINNRFEKNEGKT